MELKVTTGHFTDKREAIREISEAGWWPISWRDAPGDVYDAHKHDADQTLYLVEGQIEFGVNGETIQLHPGDKLELPAFTIHTAAAPRVRRIKLPHRQIDACAELMRDESAPMFARTAACKILAQLGPEAVEPLLDAARRIVRLSDEAGAAMGRLKLAPVVVDSGSWCASSGAELRSSPSMRSTKSPM